MSASLPTPHDDAPASSPAVTAPGEVLFREKLVPSVGTWVLVVVFGLAVFLVGAPISIPIGTAVAVVLAGLLGVILTATSPVLEVTPESLQVGRAHIERRYVGRAEAFRGDAARIAAGPAADGRAYMCFRPWVSPVVRIRIDDPADPTPYWLANARHPEDLVRALGGDPDEQDEHALEYTEPAASPEDNPGWRR